MQEFTIPQDQAVILSDAAQAHFASTAKNKVVKFGVEGGGCAGFQYFWHVYDTPEELYADDEVIQYDDFTFAVDGASLFYLMGSQVDYLTDITGSRIEVLNPLASAGCGCGVSVNFN